MNDGADFITKFLSLLGIYNFLYFTKTLISRHFHEVMGHGMVSLGWWGMFGNFSFRPLLCVGSFSLCSLR
jgi:hypothetical protein